jgi:hypothetical protein
MSSIIVTKLREQLFSHATRFPAMPRNRCPIPFQNARSFVARSAHHPFILVTAARSPAAHSNLDLRS